MATRVLIVCDGFYRFGEPALVPDFTFIRLVEILTDAGMEVTKAHRESDPSADIEGFRFDSTDSAERIDQFDEIWMFGARGRPVAPPGNSGTHNLDATEIAALEDYMNAGGGVFATGDHESIGADMCGRVPRVRLMRGWYGDEDNASPMPASFPRNFRQVGFGRADTLRRNPAGSYPDGISVWFENQSDSVPQPISPTTFPAHPILRSGDRELVVYADHMHEGKPLGPDELAGIFDYADAYPLNDGSGRSVVDFPAVDGDRKLPQVIATGQVVEPPLNLGSAISGSVSSGSAALPKTINTLCVYDGLGAGVGRIVTASTFHHYIDINLDGDSGLSADGLSADGLMRTGPDAEKGKGFYGTGSAEAAARYADIKQVFVNIANWLARPRLAMSLILERSTIGQDEATADPTLDNAIHVTIDGVRPSQFPSGGITSLGSPTQLTDWAPRVTAPDGSGVQIAPISVQSDDPSLSDRLQLFTFSYQVTVDPVTAFGFGGDTAEIQIDAVRMLGTETLSDFAVMLLVKSANPFMLDLANGNDTHWLSSDLRVFPVVTGRTVFGHLLPLDATRGQALAFLRELTSTMTVAEFESLATNQAASALSPLPTTTASGRRVYNFAIARVRLNGTVSVANDARIFFRIFTSQTTAALTFTRNADGVPTGGYRQTAGAAPISLPSPNGAGDEWLSLPMFSAPRNSVVENQTDPDNVDTIGPASGSEISKFYGALIDNNLDDDYLPSDPDSTGANVSIPELLVGEHQCLVAQIEFPGTPIPDGSKPSTSDKLSQRNIALSEVANPGRTASRVAMHTFEIEATPQSVSSALPPDELVLEWPTGTPDGTRVEIYIPTWNAQRVVDLADRFYARHEIEVVDDHTISLPGGGTRYLPVPTSSRRQTGVLSAAFPLGIKKGQRFEMSVRQITNRSRRVDIPQVVTRQVSLNQAREILNRIKREIGDNDNVPQGVFDLGNGLTLITDLRVLDEFGDYAVVLQSPDPEAVAAARARAGRWRELVGAFQFGVPVSTRTDMLNYHLRLLSLMFWRLEKLDRRSRWNATLTRYVDMLVDKVRALGGIPEAIPATPDGIFELEPAGGTPPAGDGGADGDDGGQPSPQPADEDNESTDFFEPDEDWLGTPGPATSHLWSGKVSSLLFDHFGDFEGFTLEDNRGRHRRFFSRESAILELARNAWAERDTVTVISVSRTDRTVVRFVLRGYR